MAHSSANFGFRRGMPVPVLWGGFESDTYRLGRAGWDVAMDQSINRDYIDLVLNHRKMGMWARGGMSGLSMRLDQHGRDAQPFIITNAGMINSHVHIMEPLNLVDFNKVDTNPTCGYQTVEFRNFPLFAKLFSPQPDTQELIVDPECVQSMLDQILKLQGPMRKEMRVRDQNRERDAPQSRQVHAQIISLREVA